MVASTVRSPVRSRSLTNSSRKRRRRLLCVREYRANNAPFTTSGRFTSANTGRSRLVKYGRRTAASSSVKFSEGYTPTVLPPTGPEDRPGWRWYRREPRPTGTTFPALAAFARLRSDHDPERLGGDLDGHAAGDRSRDAVDLEADRAALRRALRGSPCD